MRASGVVKGPTRPSRPLISLLFMLLIRSVCGLKRYEHVVQQYTIQLCQHLGCHPPQVEAALSNHVPEYLQYPAGTCKTASVGSFRKFGDQGLSRTGVGSFGSIFFIPFR